MAGLALVPRDRVAIDSRPAEALFDLSRARWHRDDRDAVRQPLPSTGPSLAVEDRPGESPPFRSGFPLRAKTATLTAVAAILCAVLLAGEAAFSASTEASSRPLVVLWDTAHGGGSPDPSSHGDFRNDQTATTFIDKTSGELTTGDLVGVDVLVLVEPDVTDLASAELAVVRDFLRFGGHFLFLGDRGTTGPNVAALLADVGIAPAGPIAGGMEPTSDLTSHALTAGVTSFFVGLGGVGFDASSPSVSCVRYMGQTIVAAADPGPFRFVAVGCETSLRDGYYQNGDNATLGRNIFEWFRSAAMLGRLSLDRSIYPATGTVRVELIDRDLWSATTTSVEARSSLGDVESVVLTTGEPGHFSGKVAVRPIAPVLGDMVLSVADGSTITVTYRDENGGVNGPVDVEATALIDGRAPSISGVRTVRVGPFSARVAFATDEPATVCVRFGRDLSATTQSVALNDFRTTHVVELRWLVPQARYYFTVGASDRVGNIAVDDNGGAGYDFLTCATRRSTAPINVLLLYADSSLDGVGDIEEKLLSDERIGTVDRFDYNAEVPPLSFLRDYDAVLVHANLATPNSDAIGDLLADFIDSGGPVVAMNRATVEPFAIGGRFAREGYGVMSASPSYGEGARLWLGAIDDPGHPLLDDVETFDGGPWSGHQTDVALVGASSCVARWSDGEPLVACRVAGATRLVALNFFGPSSDADPQLWQAATDGALLMANALVWASRALECDAWPTPVLLDEPDFTPGTTNTVVWANLPEADEVEIQWSCDGFATVGGSSGWLAQSLHQWTAEGLADGQSYAYRMRARSARFGYSPFSNVVVSTQDASPPQTWLAALPATTTASLLVIHVDGTDGVSGIEHAELFWRRGATGDFAPLGQLSALPADCVFDVREHGGAGIFQFKAEGVDRVGNRESKSAPDAWTHVLEPQSAARNWPQYGD